MVRGWRLVPVAAAALGAAAEVTVVALAVDSLTGGTAGWYRVIERHPVWWTAEATAAAAVTGLVVWRVQVWYERRSAELALAVQRQDGLDLIEGEAHFTGPKAVEVAPTGGGTRQVSASVIVIDAGTHDPGRYARQAHPHRHGGRDLHSPAPGRRPQHPLRDVRRLTGLRRSAGSSPRVAAPERCYCTSVASSFQLAGIRGWVVTSASLW
jgi:hypothetical protein